jgi:hypothetical protein
LFKATAGSILITVKCKMPNRLGRTVTDKGKKMCVDPEGNGVTMNEGAEGGPSPPGAE